MLLRIMAAEPSAIADVYLNCIKCHDRYSEKNIPRNLTCGHTLCTVCVKEISETGAQCLECRGRIFVEDVGNSPINYPLLKCVLSVNENPTSLNAVLSQVISSQVIGPEACSSKEALECPKHGSPVVVLCLSCRLWACQDCMVFDHRTPPRGSCKTASITKALEKLMAEYEGITNIICKRLKFIENNLAPEDARIAFLTKICPTKNEHVKLTGAINTALSDIKKMDETSINNVKAVLEKLPKTVKKITSLKKMISFQEKLISQEKALKDYIMTEGKRKLALHHEVRQHLSSDLKLLADGGTPMYAVQHVIRYNYSSPVKRWAQIVSRDNHLLVTCLKEGNVPQNGISIPYDYVRETVPKDFPSVFFEFGKADNEASDLVVVRLRNHINTQVRHIVRYCSGEGETSSYKGTSLFKVEQQQNVVYGGDLENNDGTGSDDAHDHPFFYSKRTKWKTHECMFACEHISTSKFAFRYKNARSYCTLLIGWVSSGVDFICKLCEDNDTITGIIVKECGLVISLVAEELDIEEEGNAQEVSEESDASELDDVDLGLFLD